MSIDENEVFTGQGSDWHNRALLNFSQDVPWFAYASGYKEAADRLVEGIAGGMHGQDMLVFPIFYLYRHYLEVSIKERIKECQKVLDTTPPLLPKNKAQRIRAAQGHDLEELWGYLKTLLSSVYPDLAHEVLSEIDRVVEAFHRHDRGGDAARYPIGLDGERTLSGLREINLRKLAEDMARADSSLTTIGGGIDYMLDQRQLAADHLHDE
jgi:hypothetical protein